MLRLGEDTNVPVVRLLFSIRSKGWMVAVHNDYVQDGRLGTFWLFTKGNLAAKGESFVSDYDAIKKALEEIRRIDKVGV